MNDPALLCRFQRAPRGPLKAIHKHRQARTNPTAHLPGAGERGQVVDVLTDRVDNATPRVAHTRPQPAHPRPQQAALAIDACPSGLTRFACLSQFHIRFETNTPVLGTESTTQTGKQRRYLTYIFA